jgi:hypothetical protein
VIRYFNNDIAKTLAGVLDLPSPLLTKER